MKATLKNNSSPTFPKLMTSTIGDIVILAVSINKEGFYNGFLLYDTTKTPIGYHSTAWSKDFVDYKGELTLSSD